MSEGAEGKAKAGGRTFIGSIVRPTKQIKYAFYFVGGGMLMLTFFIGVTLYYVRQTVRALESAYHLESEVSMALSDSLSGLLILALVVAAVFSVLSIIVGLRMSNHFYGPIVPILRHIENLKSGNYSSRVRLRKADELTEISDGLNQLAEALESRRSVGGDSA